MKRKLIATKRGYVRRLRQVLEQEDECKCCPAVVGFNINLDRGHQFCAIGTNLRIWCRTFIDLEESGGCPCLCYEAKQGEIDPIELAHAAIARWDAGKHKWQLDG